MKVKNNFLNIIFLYNISNNGFYLQIGNGSIIVNPLKSTIIFLEYIKVSPTSNDLIQAIYSRLNEV